MKVSEIEKKIVEKLKGEVNYALNLNEDLEIATNELHEFEQFLEELSSTQTTIEEYVKKFNENQFVSSIDNKKFSDLSQKLQDSIGSDKVHKKAWGSEISGVLNKVKNEIKKIKNGSFDFSQEDRDSGEVTFVGYSVKVSGVAKFISTARVDIKHVRIFALDEVVMDADLNLSGGDVTVIAPLWNITKEITINLKGKAGADYSTSATSGANGMSGKPGDSGGHFLGIGADFVNLEHLNLNVDGGKGGYGQRGGDGLAGQDLTHSLDLSANDQVRPLIEWLKYTDSVSHVVYSNEFKNFVESHPYGKGLLDKIRLKWHETIDVVIKGNQHLFKEQGDYLINLKEFTEITIKQFHEANKHSFEHKKLFKRGSSILTKRLSFDQSEHQLRELNKQLFTDEKVQSKLSYGIGGDAGSGGIGGLGGAPGTHEIISLRGTIEKKYQPLQGESGNDGASGNVGSGNDGASGNVGSGGRVVLNLQDLSHKSGMCCISSKAPIHTVLNMVAPPGAIRYTTNHQSNVEAVPTEAPNLRLSLLDYQVLLGQKSKMMHTLSKSFSRKLKDTHTDDNVSDFAAELLHLEEYISKSQLKFDFATAYNQLAKRISVKANSSKDPQEIKVLKYLYTSALTSISQLNAASNQKLVINLEEFLSNIKSNIGNLEKATSMRLVQKYKTNYAKEILGKIDEAKSFADELVEDIKNAGNMLDAHFKKYLADIEKDIKQAAQSSVNLQTSKAKLQNAIIKTTLFSTLSIAVSSAGIVFGPPGAIVAKIVQIGINILDNPDFQEHDLLVENLDKLASGWDINNTTTDALDNASSQISSFTSSLKPAMSALSALSKNFKNEKAKLASVTTAIKQAESLITQLKDHKEQMTKSFSKYLEQIINKAKEINQDLEDKSVVAIEFNKMEVNNFFKSTKAELSKIAGKSTDGFCEAIGKMIEALETSMKIHEHIQEYKDQITFANYIAQVNSPGFKESIASGELGQTIQKLEKITQCNIALEQYYLAVSVIKQWSFPFAHNFLENFDEIQDLLSLSEKEFISAIQERIDSIINEVAKGKTYIGDMDHLIKKDDFTEEPFFTWSYDTHPNEIVQLLNHKQVFLYADVKHSPIDKGAIKFNTIRFQIKIDGSEEEQKNLNSYQVQMQHSGNSYYLYAGNIYSVKHNILKMSFTPTIPDLTNVSDSFEKIHEFSKKHPMLSPYTWWAVKLKDKSSGKQMDERFKMPTILGDREPDSPLLNKFKENLPKIQIQLIGKGRYVDESEISAYQNESFKVDTYYDRVISSIPQFRLAQDIKIQTNAFNQRENPNYAYKSRDIELIQSKLSELNTTDFTILPPNPSDQILRSTIRNLNKPALLIYSLDNLNWTAIALIRNSKIFALCTNNKHQEALSEKLTDLGIEEILYSKQEYKSTDSGPLSLFSIAVLRNIIPCITAQLTSNFHETFETNVDDLNEWRSKFAIEYANALYTEIESKKANGNAIDLSEFIVSLDLAPNDTVGRALAKKLYNDKDHSLTELIDAAQNCDPEAIQTIITTDNIDINKPDNSGRTLLHWATIHNDTAAIESLISKGADIELQDEYGQTPLHSCIEEGYIETFKQLLSKGASIESQDYGYRTPLHYASSGNHLTITKLLLEQGVDIEAEDFEGQTPLYVAAENGHLEIVKYLLSQRANIEAKAHQEYLGWTPLYTAAKNGHVEVVKYLLSQGADVNTKNKDDDTILHFETNIEIVKLMLENGADANAKNTDECTPLLLALYNGQLEIAKLLIKKGADVEADSNSIPWPLAKSAAEGYLEIIQLLLEEKLYDPKSLDHYKFIALCIAADNDHMEVVNFLWERIENPNKLGLIIKAVEFGHGYLKAVKFLIEQGADVDFIEPGYSAQTPLHASSERGYFKIAELLINNKASIYIKDIDSKTPLDLARENNYEEIVKLLEDAESKTKSSYALFQAATEGNLDEIKSLITQGANIKTKNQDGWTVLDLAISQEHFEIVDWIFKNFSNLSFKKDGPWTPLHAAAKLNNTNIANFLLSKGCNIEIQDRCGKTPLNIACEEGNLEIIKLLLEKGADIDAIESNLCIAVEYDRLEVMKVLLEKGANIEKKDRFSSYPPLNLAALMGRLEMVKLLLDKGANIESKNTDGETPLHAAALIGELEIVELLLDKGASIEAKDSNGRTPLHTAASKGNLATVKLLLDRGASIEAKDPVGQVPLDLARENYQEAVIELLEVKMSSSWVDVIKLSADLLIAAENGDYYAVHSLLDKGANINVINEVGQTSLDLAAENGHERIVQLLQAKASGNTEAYERLARNITTETTDEHPDDETHAPTTIDVAKLSADLLIAAQNDNYDSVCSLLDQGADVNFTNEKQATALIIAAPKGYLKIVEILLNKGANIDAATNKGNTSLIIAVCENQQKVVECLLNKGANINLENKDGINPLLAAVLCKNINLVQILLDKGANLKARDKWGRSAFDLAKESSHAEIIQLIESKISPNVDLTKLSTDLLIATEKNDYESVYSLLNQCVNLNIINTALISASGKGYLRIVQLLLDKGANVTVYDEDGNTPLHLAVNSGSVDTIKLLLDKGSNIEARTIFGWTPLLIAAINSDVAIVRLLLDKSANIEVHTEGGGTPLHYAAENGYMKVIRLLLDKGANIQAINQNGQTPLDLAIENNHEQIVELLKAKLSGDTAAYECLAASIDTTDHHSDDEVQVQALGDIDNSDDIF